MIWHRTDEEGWHRQGVGPEGLTFIESGNEELTTSMLAETNEGAVAIVIPFDEDGVERLVLLSSPASRQVWVDGSQPIAQVVEPKTEIRIAGTSYWIAESESEDIVNFEENGDGVSCARCGIRLQTGDEIARSACCKAPFHAGMTSGEPPEELRCLSYDPECPSCGRVRADEAWTPEDESDA